MSAAGVRHVSLRSGVYADSVGLMQVGRDVWAREGVSLGPGRDGHPAEPPARRRYGPGPDGEPAPDELLVAITAVDALATRERSTGRASTRCPPTGRPWPS